MSEQTSVINILSPQLADKIAAGEVVERPASVIKELTENSIDAGAKKITVEIKKGGVQLIRCSDDGCGMLPEDAGLCFMRHATSKIKSERDLEAIGTMGFRGEALAAISAVSQIDLITKKRSADVDGVHVTLNAGEIDEMYPTGCPEGTSISVKSLFYNTPARLKFLKSDRAEAAACVDITRNVALGNPDVSFKMLRDGEEEFFTPGSGDERACISALFGRDFALSLLPVEGGTDRISVRGFVSSPGNAQGNRTKQLFFINGRYIKSQLIRTALEQAYKNRLLPGRFPAAVIYINLSNAAVDVNVHPTKTEVRFSDEKAVFEAVYHAVCGGLDRENTLGKSSSFVPNDIHTVSSTLTPSSETTTAKTAGYSPDAGSSQTKATYSSAGMGNTLPKASSSSFGVGNSLPKVPTNSFGKSSDRVLSGGYSPVGGNYSASKGISSRAHTLHSPSFDYKSENAAPITAEAPSNNEPANRQTIISPMFNQPEIAKKNEELVAVIPEEGINYRLVGEVLKTYIIVEKDNGIILIDKHAAHERILFDKFKASGMLKEDMLQLLLTPVIYTPLSGEEVIIRENLEIFTQLGFSPEEFGSREFIFRSVPYGLEPEDVIPTVQEYCEKIRIRGVKGLDTGKRRDELLHTVACKAAVKAGYDNELCELDVLVKRVLSGEIKYCPHGRPVAVCLSRNDLDKMFKRIV